MEATCTPEELSVAQGRGVLTPAQTVIVGDLVRYRDREGTECHIRVKDHGSSALRGEFFITTTILDESADLGQHDQEMTVEEMQQIIRNRF
jgi:hypothetical protein